MSLQTLDHLIKIKKERPPILNITKYFPLELIVCGLRGIGALPITSNAEQEIDDLLKLSKAVVINLGKLDDEFVQLCARICHAANKLKIPIILDPVGAGASHYRTETSLRFIKNHEISIVRGYPSEIAALLNGELTAIGTESKTNDLAIEHAKLLSKKHNMTVVLSGKINSVIDTDRIEHFNFDSSLLLKVAGIGSLLSSIIGAFHAVEENRCTAAIIALTYYTFCVGIAKNKAAGPGSFKTELLDQLYINSDRAVEW